MQEQFIVEVEVVQQEVQEVIEGTIDEELAQEHQESEQKTCYRSGWL